jgi:hypothetical protein
VKREAEEDWRKRNPQTRSLCDSPPPNVADDNPRDVVELRNHHRSKSFVPMSFVLDLAQSCRENDDLVTDLARFSEGIYPEAAIRRKYRDLLSDDDWVHLATDDLLVEMIETRKLQRVRDGSYNANARNSSWRQKRLTRSIRSFAMRKYRPGPGSRAHKF